MGINNIKARRFLFRGILAALLIAAGVYAALVYSLVRQDPVFLLACMESEATWHAWTCEKVLRHASLTPAQVHELNEAGGARFPVAMNNPGRAEEMLALFLSRGVDIDARDPQAKGWTALHGVSIAGEANRVAMLLRHGAKVDLRDEDERTPLDLAQMVQQKRGSDSNIDETVRLLKAAQHKS